MKKSPSTTRWESILRAVPWTVFLIAMVFAVYTDHQWEDFYITYKTSKNWAMGHGPVYIPGERVPVFTSPLNLSVPAFFSWVLGADHDRAVLWCYRVVCASCLGLASHLLIALCKKENLPTFWCIAVGVIPFLESKIIDYTINGQEAAFLILFTSLQLFALCGKNPASWIWLGVSFAGMMYSRPDGFVSWVSLTFGWLIFISNKLDGFKLAGKALLLGVIGYLPWLIGCWVYYGTVIPNSISAKGLGAHFDLFVLVKNTILLPFWAGAYGGVVDQMLLPPYSDFGGWHYTLHLVSRVICLVSMLLWLVPWCRPRTRMLSLGAFTMILYWRIIRGPYPYPWYLSLPAFLVLLTFIIWLADRVCAAKKLEETKDSELFLWGGSLCKAASGVALFCGIYVLGILLACGYQMRISQHIVEEGVRKQVGLWLKAHASGSNDTIFMEPLGYFGFFSGLKTYESVGLSSKEVQAARRKVGENWKDLIQELQPDWLILRPWERDGLSKEDPALLNQSYQWKKSFDVKMILQQIKYLPGRPYVECDAAFYIYKKINTDH